MKDIVDQHWDDSAWWTTTNLGEAVPGVLTPMNWTFWGPQSERALRRAFIAFGALEPKFGDCPEHDRERIMGVFHGRFAAKVSFLGDMGDRLPGTSGAAVAEQTLGALPPDFVSKPTLSRLPVIARRFPRTAWRAPGDVRRLRTNTAAWWSRACRSMETAELSAARAQLVEAAAHFEYALQTHIRCTFAVVQPVFDQVLRLAELAGDRSLGGRLLAGQGLHAELEMVEDLWELSRERLSLDTFLERHGYHGPNEGEIASRVWREDSSPVLARIAAYAARDDAQSPEHVMRERVTDRHAAERELLRGLPRSRRQIAELVLRLSQRHGPLRGVGKVAYVQSVDVGRAAARAIGRGLASAGSIDDPDDVMFLTFNEAARTMPGSDLRETVAWRRTRHAEHQAVVVPSAWKGRPDVISATAADADREGLVLTGVGASPGVVEGTARVVLDPSFSEVENGEILVAPFTDPSWASVMFTSSALVVDIGGSLSHAAVVARELGIPCVMGTGDGTRRIADGDVCRVDGVAGTLEVLHPCTQETP